jgi:hypothetical protein
MHGRRARFTAIASSFATVVLTGGVCTVSGPLGTTASAAAGVGRTTHIIDVTRANNGRTYQIHLNDHLVVTLSGPAVYKWSMPTASKIAVLERTAGQSGSTATATFIAMKKGRSDVTRCRKSQLPSRVPAAEHDLSHQSGG